MGWWWPTRCRMMIMVSPRVRDSCPTCSPLHTYTRTNNRSLNSFFLFIYLFYFYWNELIDRLILRVIYSGPPLVGNSTSPHKSWSPPNPSCPYEAHSHVILTWTWPLPYCLSSIISYHTPNARFNCHLFKLFHFHEPIIKIKFVG